MVGGCLVCGVLRLVGFRVLMVVAGRLLWVYGGGCRS